MKKSRLVTISQMSILTVGSSPDRSRGMRLCPPSCQCSTVIELIFLRVQWFTWTANWIQLEDELLKLQKSDQKLQKSDQFPDEPVRKNKVSQIRYVTSRTFYRQRDENVIGPHMIFFFQVDQITKECGETDAIGGKSTAKRPRTYTRTYIGL